MRLLAVVAVAALAAVGADARLRGSRAELQAELEGIPALLEVRTAIRANAPASKVLELLQNMMDETRKAQEEDDARFQAMKATCAADAGEEKAKAHSAVAAVREAEQDAAAASRRIEEAHHTIVSAAQQESDEDAAIAMEEKRLASIEAAFADNRASFRRSDDAYNEALHAIDAVIAHISAESGMQAPMLLQLGETVSRAGAAQEHVDALADAADQVGAAAAANEAEVNAVEEVAAPSATGVAGIAADLAPEPSATGVGGDLTVRIVDMILSLRKSLEEQREDAQARFNDATAAFNAEVADVKARMQQHRNLRKEAIATREESEAGRLSSVECRKDLHEKMAGLHAAAAKADADALAAAKQCEEYAAQFEDRRKEREQDLEAARAVYELIREKQRAIREKLAIMESLYSDVSGHEEVPSADSASEFADKMGVKEDEEISNLPVPEQDEISETQAAIEAQARELEEEALGATGATGATGAHDSVAFGSVSGGDN